MFKSIKSKILSLLVIVGALTQTGKAESVMTQKPLTQTPSVENRVEKANVPSVPKEIPVAGLIGVAAAGVLAGIGVMRSDRYEDRYYRQVLGDVKIDPKRVQAKGAENSASAVSMVVKPIEPENNMDQAARDFLAKRLHAIREMEDIKRERARLTRQMAKAKNAGNEKEQQRIKECRRYLSAIYKSNFACAAGPAYGQIKDERRLLTKKMALARRRKDDNMKAEITARRASLKAQEKMVKDTVRSFKYKQERAKFIKRKPVVENRFNLIRQDLERAMAA